MYILGKFHAVFITDVVPILYYFYRDVSMCGTRERELSTVR